MPMMPQRAYSQMRQPSGDYTQWPQHLTAKQALGLQQRPALPSFQPPQIMLQQGPQQELLSSAQVVGNGQKQQDGGDSLESLTKTQEIFVYQKSPSTSPKGHQESTPDACDEVSFADQGSVVIHGGNAALPNIQNITTEVLSSRERFSSPPAKDHRTEKEIAECLANAAEERNLEAVCEAMRRAHLAGMNPDLMLQGLADAVNRTHLGGGGDGHIEVFDAADVKAEAPTSGFASRDEPTSGSATPASTIGIVGEVREDLIKLIRMPTRPLDEVTNQLSPICSYGHASGVATPPLECIVSIDVSEALQNEPTAVASLSLDPVREPASEPTVTVDPSFVHTPTTSMRGLVNQLDETSHTATPVHTSTHEELAQAPRSSWRPSIFADDAPPVYGLDAELKAKSEANYDNSAEDRAAQWVQDITGVQVVGEFGEALRTGQVLCQLINCIRPFTIKKVNPAGAPFKERENISKFLKVCRDWGVHEYALFSTDDLYDEKNLMSVVKCIHQLGGAIPRAVPEFQGPHLGIADTSKAKRDAKRALDPVSQTGGLQCAMTRSHVDVLSNGNVRNPNRGGC